MDNTVRIKDTGKATSDGDVVYTQYDNGNWIDLQGFNLTFESNTGSTAKVGYVTEDFSTLGYSKNETTVLYPMRITLRGTIKDVNPTLVANLLGLQKKKGVKQLSGGLGTINAIKDGTDTYDYINVIITNITIGENLPVDRTNAGFTVQMVRV